MPSNLEDRNNLSKRKSVPIDGQILIESKFCSPIKIFIKKNIHLSLLLFSLPTNVASNTSRNIWTVKIWMHQ